MGYERTALPTGVRVLSEVVPGQRSVSVGAWLGTGSRDERAELCGVTHFLEHLVFRGTPRRSALALAETFDAIGGDLNAFTTKELTCFHARALAQDLPLCVDAIGDMLRNALLDPADVEAERTVVLEEIAMHDDTPDDSVYDLFSATLWPEQAVGRPVQGLEETVAGMTRDALVDHYSERFTTADLVVAAAGNVEHDELVSLVADAFRDVERDPRPARTPATNADGAVAIRERDIEQVQLVYGVPGVARGDDRRWALEVFNVAFGGGMSSRLSQEIREKRGLVYSVASGNSALTDTGMFTVYAGCSAERVSDVLGLVREQIDLVLTKGITDEERVRAIGHLRGSILLSLDDPGARMSHLGKSELLLDRILTPEQMIARVEAVTLDDVRAVVDEVLGSRAWTLAMLGPVTESDARALGGAAA